MFFWEWKSVEYIKLNEIFRKHYVDTKIAIKARNNHRGFHKSLCRQQLRNVNDSPNMFYVKPTSIDQWFSKSSNTCVRACVHACVRTCVRTCARMCVCFKRGLLKRSEAVFQKHLSYINMYSTLFLHPHQMYLTNCCIACIRCVS